MHKTCVVRVRDNERTIESGWPSGGAMVHKQTTTARLLFSHLGPATTTTLTPPSPPPPFPPLPPTPTPRSPGWISSPNRPRCAYRIHPASIHLDKPRTERVRRGHPRPAIRDLLRAPGAHLVRRRAAGRAGPRARRPPARVRGRVRHRAARAGRGAGARRAPRREPAARADAVDAPHPRRRPRRKGRARHPARPPLARGFPLRLARLVCRAPTQPPAESGPSAAPCKRAGYTHTLGP
jgi:hypothetical protein